MTRVGSPSSTASTLMTSAPWSAMNCVMIGPGRKRERSMTRRPSSFMVVRAGRPSERGEFFSDQIPHDDAVVDLARAICRFHADAVAQALLVRELLGVAVLTVQAPASREDVARRLHAEPLGHRRFRVVALALVLEPQRP